MSADDFPVLASRETLCGRGTDFVLVVVDRGIVRCILVTD